MAVLFISSVMPATAADNLPDLVITSVKGPGACTQGDDIEITCTVKNLKGSSSGPFFVSVMLSPDQNISSSDIYLRQFYVSGLGKGSASTETVSILVQGSVPDGQFYIGAIADRAGDVVENNESNNAGYSDETLFIWGNYTGNAIPAWTTEPPFGFAEVNSTDEPAVNMSGIEAELKQLIGDDLPKESKGKGIPGFEFVAAITGLSVVGFIRSRIKKR